MVIIIRLQFKLDDTMLGKVTQLGSMWLYNHIQEVLEFAVNDKMIISISRF